MTDTEHAASSTQAGRIAVLTADVKTALGSLADDEAITNAYGEISVRVAAGDIVDALCRLRDAPGLKFTQLIDLTAADYPERADRFDVVYHLLSLSRNARLRLRVTVGEDDTVPTAVTAFPSAGWCEREVYDMYGIPFADHPDLRRILTDYGFQGHPLRKDFPMTGHVEVRYDIELRRVVYEPVKLTQDFRSFDFMSPWEGAPYILPGDEKAGSQG